MEHGAWFALGVVALLAGCADPAAVSKPSGAPEAPATMSIAGLVQDAAFMPIAAANVSVRFTDEAAKTDAAGRFRLDGLVRSAYLVDVSAPGFENASLTAEPGEVASLEFVLEVVQDLRPRNVTVQFHGSLECALEAVIISPSCDSALTDPRVGGPGLFEAKSTFEPMVERNWRSLVVDVDFDPAANPGLDGLRVTARGRNDDNSLGTYEQYGQFHGPGPFTFRLEPGQSYAEGDGPVPLNATTFRLEVYPQSHGWHEVCGVPLFDCTLGAGAGRNVAFDLFVTAFYNEPAPAGWSMFGQPA